MNVLIWIVGVLLWLGAWGIYAARAAARSGDDGVVKLAATIGPAFVVSTWLLALALAPSRLSIFWTVTRIAHNFATCLLFGFLLAAEFLLIEAWWKIRMGAPVGAVVVIYRRLWILTETCPAPIALTILFSGLRLIWQVPDKDSPADAWLFGMIVLFSIFFWDGILNYQPIVRAVYQAWRDGEERNELTRVIARKHPSYWESIQLFIHLLSWPFVFALGVFKWDSDNALTQNLARCVHLFGALPNGWPEVSTAIFLWLASGLGVWTIRALISVFGKRRLAAD